MKTANCDEGQAAFRQLVLDGPRFQASWNFLPGKARSLEPIQSYQTAIHHRVTDVQRFADVRGRGCVHYMVHQAEVLQGWRTAGELLVASHRPWRLLPAVRWRAGYEPQCELRVRQCSL